MHNREKVLESEEIKLIQEEAGSLRKRFKKTIQNQHNVDKEIDMYLGGITTFPENLSEKDQLRLVKLLETTIIDDREKIYCIKKMMTIGRKILGNSKKS